jgi:nucleotide-binding universal stress UspA family protein
MSVKEFRGLKPDLDEAAAAERGKALVSKPTALKPAAKRERTESDRILTPMPAPQRSPARTDVFRHVLLCLDRSPCSEVALPYAIALARMCSAKLTLLHTLERTDLERRHEAVDALGWEIARAEARAYLQHTRENIQAAGVDCDAVLAEGHAAEQALRLEQRLDVDLIALASHGTQGVSCWNLGSTAEKIVAQAHASVFVSPARNAPPAGHESVCRRILVPLDGSLRSESALPAALHLARTPGSKLILAHVVRAPEMFRCEALSSKERKQIDALVQRNDEQACSYMSELNARFTDDALDIETRVVRGDDVFRTLLELVEREHIDLVSLVAHGAGAAAHHVRGSLARQFLTRTLRPVLIVQDLSHPELIRATAVQFTAERAPRLGGLNHEVLS